MAKTITRSDVRRMAAEQHWSEQTERLDNRVALVPMRDIYIRESLTLSVSWNLTPFSDEPRFAFAMLEGGGIPIAVPNILGKYREKSGFGACVVDILRGSWRP